MVSNARRKQLHGRMKRGGRVFDLECHVSDMTGFHPRVHFIILAPELADITKLIGLCKSCLTTPNTAPSARDDSQKSTSCIKPKFQAGSGARKASLIPFRVRFGSWFRCGMISLPFRQIANAPKQLEPARKVVCMHEGNFWATYLAPGAVFEVFRWS